MEINGLQNVPQALGWWAVHPILITGSDGKIFISKAEKRKDLLLHYESSVKYTLHFFIKICTQENNHFNLCLAWKQIEYVIKEYLVHF